MLVGNGELGELLKFSITESFHRHCVKNVQMRGFFYSYFPVFSPNTGKYGPEKTPYLDTFHAVRQ